MTDFPDFQMPTAVAVQVAANGTLLLRGTKNMGATPAVTIPAGGSVTLLSTAPVGQIGYEGQFSCFMPAASGSVPFLRANFLWTDSFTGLAVGQRNFYLTCGNGASNALSYYIAGPVRGNQLTVTVTNLDAGVNATLQWGINQTSHVYAADKLIQPAYASTAPNGFTNPAGNPSAGVIADTNPTVPGSTTVYRLCACYGGRAFFAANQPTSGISVNVYLTDPVQTGSGLYGNANGRYGGFQGLSGANGQTEIALPYGPMAIQVVNTSASSVGVTATLVAEDY